MLVYKDAIFVLNLVYVYSASKIIFSLITIVSVTTTILVKFANKDFMLTDKKNLVMFVMLYVRVVYHQLFVCFVSLKNIY